MDVESDEGEDTRPVSHLLRQYGAGGHPANGGRKSWVGTLFDNLDAAARVLEKLECTYVVWGKETTSEGRLHLQVCVTFRKSMRFAALRKLFPGGHWEVCKAVDAARNYCMKVFRLLTTISALLIGIGRGLYYPGRAEAGYSFRPFQGLCGYHRGRIPR